MYQGRQYHQWFGHGTKPGDDKAVPASLDDRIRTLGLTAIAALRPEERRHPAAAFDAASLGHLENVMRALVASLDEPAHDVAERLLNTNGVNPVAQHLRRVAELVEAAKTTADMRDATDALAQAMRAVGLDRWRARLNDVAGRVELVANADDARGNDAVRDIARRLGMSRGQREMLHRAISRKGYELEDIKIIAREIMENFPNK